MNCNHPTGFARGFVTARCGREAAFLVDDLFGRSDVPVCAHHSLERCYSNPRRVEERFFEIRVADPVDAATPPAVPIEETLRIAHDPEPAPAIYFCPWSECPGAPADGHAECIRHIGRIAEVT